MPNVSGDVRCKTYDKPIDGEVQNDSNSALVLTDCGTPGQCGSYVISAVSNQNNYIWTKPNGHYKDSQDVYVSTTDVTGVLLRPGHKILVPVTAGHCTNCTP